MWVYAVVSPVSPTSIVFRKMLNPIGKAIQVPRGCDVRDDKRYWTANSPVGSKDLFPSLAPL